MLTLLVLAAVAGCVRADDDDPVLRGRKLSEWLEMLRGERAETSRQVAVGAIGSAAGQRTLWQPGMMQMRRAALLAVEVSGPKNRQVFPALVAILADDPEEKIREGAALSLGRMAGRMVEEAKENSRRTDPEGFRDKKYKEDKLPLIGVRDGLATALRGDKSPRVREACATSLGKLEWSASLAVPALAQALKDDNLGVRSAAVEALRRIGDDAAQALPALQDVLKDDKGDRLIRAQAAQALGRLGPDAPVDLELLLKVWHDPAAPTEVRADVAEALGALKKTSAAIDLGNELANPKNATEVRRAAAVTLDGFGSDARPAVGQLRAALKDEDKFVRSLAMHSLGKIKDFGEERKNVVKDLVAGLSDRVLEVRVAAVETLAALGADGLGDDLAAVVERLTETKRDGQKAVREAAADALKKLGK